MRRLAAWMLALATGVSLAGGRAPDPERTQIDPAVTRIDEQANLGNRLDRGTLLLDERGQRFTFGELLGKPTILVLSYFGCDGSCPTINRNLAHALPGVTRFQPGKDYQVLTVSFDRQDNPQRAGEFIRQLHSEVPGADRGWRFAVLEDAAADAPQRFARQVGFNFFWSRYDKTFLHPNVLVFLTPDGRVARYLYGTAMDPQNLQLALIDADWGRISESKDAIFDMVTGACYSFNYADGHYQLNYALLTGVASLLFGLGSIGLGLWAYRKKLARRPVHAH